MATHAPGLHALHRPPGATFVALLPYPARFHAPQTGRCRRLRSEYDGSAGAGAPSFTLSPAQPERSAGRRHRLMTTSGPSSAPDVVLFERTTPILRIFDEAKAREFYFGYLGFTADWEHRFGENFPLYMQVSRAGLTLHLSEHHGDEIGRAHV